MLVWIWLGCLLTAVFLYLNQAYGFFKKRGVKTPSIIPPFGTTFNTIVQRNHYTDMLSDNYNELADQRFYGTFTFLKPIVYVRDIELIKKIVVKDFEHFVDHNHFFNEEDDQFFGKNLMSLTGQEWKDMRSTLSPAFTSAKMKMMLPLMVEVGDQMIRALKTKIKESGQGYLDIDVRNLTTRCANDVIASCAFGLKVDSHKDEDNKFYMMGKAASSAAFSIRQLIGLFYRLLIPKVVRIFKCDRFPASVENFFRSLVLETMETREQQHIMRHDMIHLLMEVKKGKLTHDENTSQDSSAGFATVEESSFGQKKVNRVWSDDEICAQATLFFVAGFDTVSTVMSFLLHELAINPDVQEKLYKEIKENEAKNNGIFDYNSIQNMVYMDMVISETLRLWPSGFLLDRHCNKDYNLGKPNDAATEDYIISKGEALAIPVWAIHRNPEYHPNPNKFDPERFSEVNKRNIQPFTYMPFGLGPRNCIGSRFALFEMKVMVYQLLNSFEISPSSKTSIPAKVDPTSLILRIKGGHWARFKPRKAL